MEIGFLHLHKTVVVIFLLLILSKVVLLLAGKKELLQKLRSKTRVADMILGGLILITGIYLFFLKANPEVYLYAKIILVLISIPLGIVGFKKQKPILAVMSLSIIIYMYGIAETRSLSFKPPKFDLPAGIKNESSLSRGEVIYQSLCIDCHGSDGKKGLFKAPDLTTSKLTLQQRLDVISNGKGLMQPYSRQLNEEEIESVLEYIGSLK
jgi:cytochrome c553